MNKKLLAALLGGAMLLAGCSSASDTTSTTTTDQTTTTEKANTTENTESSTTNSQTSTTAASTKFDEIRSAFESAGYTIQDLDTDADSISFDAINDNGTIEVEAKVETTLHEAQNEFQDTLQSLNQDDYMRLTTTTLDNGEMVQLLNNYNTVYAYAVLDNTNNLVIEVENILEGQLDGVTNVLSSLGYQG